MSSEWVADTGVPLALQLLAILLAWLFLRKQLRSDRELMERAAKRERAERLAVELFSLPGVFNEPFDQSVMSATNRQIRNAAVPILSGDQLSELNRCVGDLIAIYMVCEARKTPYPDSWPLQRQAIAKVSEPYRQVVYDFICVFTTLIVKNSIDEAVSCRLDAVLSVRLDKSMLPLAISVDATAIESAERRTSPTIALSDSCIWFNAVNNWVNSS